MTDSSKFELHYFFSDNTHSMNASIRNDNEKEVLFICRELIQQLELQIEIESEALAEGGLKNIWKFIGKHDKQLTLLAVVLALIMSRVPVENKKLIALQEENLTLDNEIKRNELRKIKNEITQQEIVNEELVKRVVDIVESNYKVRWHVSNFYKRSYSVPKIDSISTNRLSKDNEPVDEDKTVYRNDFNDFVLKSNKLPEFIDEEAVIEIISPVLKPGKFKWKGYYKGVIVGFLMSDEKFKESIRNGSVEFVNGTTIKCVIRQKRKIDDLGNVKSSNPAVVIVLEVLNNKEILKTEQSIKYLKEKRVDASQMTLNLDLDTNF